MSFTANKNYNNQSPGSNPGTWGLVLNTNFTTIDNNLGGTLNISVAGSSNVTLTLAQAQYIIHNLTGILTGNITYSFPAGGIYQITNSTTGAFTVTVIMAGGTGVVVPQGSSRTVFIDAVNTIARFDSVSTAALPSGDILVGNASGIATAVAVSGDAVLSNTGALTVTKTNGVAFGTAATVNTGTSGATIPLLNANNAFSGANTFLTQSAGDASTKAATTAFVTSQPTINQPNLVGTTTNDSAASGSIGEYISSTVLIGSAVSLTSAAPANITSISLTAGDWDVEGLACFNPAGSTTTSFFSAGINTVSAVFQTAPAGGFTQFNIINNTIAAPQFFPTGTTRISLSVTTTVYLVAESGFGVSTMSVYGLLRARRVR